MKKKILAAILLIALCLPMAACKKADKQYKKISDLNGKYIGMTMGSTYINQLAENDKLSDAQVSYIMSENDGIAMLLAGKIDAFATERLKAENYIRKQPGMVILDEPLASASYSFAFKSGNFLKEEFSEAIVELKKDGTIDELFDKWMNYVPGETTTISQTWRGTKTLTCVCEPSVDVLCFTNENDYVIGFDIDVILSVAQKLGYRVSFERKVYSELLPMVSGAYADLACSGIIADTSRSSFVEYCEEYLPADSVLVVREGSQNGAKNVLRSRKDRLSRAFLDEDRWVRLGKGTLTTIGFCIIVMLGSLIVGWLFFILNYQIGGFLPKLIGAIGAFIDLIPALTWIFIVYYIVFAGVSRSNYIAGLVAFIIMNSFGVSGILSGCVASVSAGEKEAAKSMGYTKLTALKKIYLPQTKSQLLDGLKGVTIGTIKMSSLIELIAVNDLQAMADAVRAETADPYITLVFAALVYAILVYISSKLINKIDASTSIVRSEEEIKNRILKGGF
ncbi:MAG: transporter substrate-binding domain-containing protein [Clostridia bacterium]|nr:transporter substrate-binding domain-containing protein [Clostridia bacterium]